MCVYNIVPTRRVLRLGRSPRLLASEATSSSACPTPLERSSSSCASRHVGLVVHGRTLVHLKRCAHWLFPSRPRVCARATGCPPFNALPVCFLPSFRAWAAAHCTGLVLARAWRAPLRPPSRHGCMRRSIEHARHTGKVQGVAAALAVLQERRMTCGHGCKTNT
jgi:hypothetical protein